MHLYSNTHVIIDCTKIYIEMPTTFWGLSAIYSTYKNHNTAKGLIGIFPAGYPTFISKPYPGLKSLRTVAF